MSKPDFIELDGGISIAILYEDRSVLALDKPPGWMLVPHSWQKTNRNLQAAIVSSIGAGHFWARSRHLEFLRFVHRLDAETSGVLLFGKSPGAVNSYSELFAARKMQKVYLAVVRGVPTAERWICQAKLGPDRRLIGRVRVDEAQGKEAETEFRVRVRLHDRTLVEIRPVTGRTHQIRVHAAVAGHPVLGDPLYGPPGSVAGITRPGREKLGLRAVELSYRDPFTRRPVCIRAPTAGFLAEFGFGETTG